MLLNIGSLDWPGRPAPAQPRITPRPNPSRPQPRRSVPADLSPARPAPDGLPEDFWAVDLDAVLNPPAERCYQMDVDIFFNARHILSAEEENEGEHAHSYRVQAHCQSRVLAPDQAPVGFGVVYTYMSQVVKAYNNHMLNDLPPFSELEPTTENLTAILFQQLQRRLKDLPVDLTGVTVWESPTKAITYQNRP